MMISIYWIIPAAIAGYVLCIVRMSFDKSVVTLSDDECVVKKPYDGFIIAQVPPDVVREIVRQRDKENKPTQSIQAEARDIYRKRDVVAISSEEAKSYSKKILPNLDQK